MLADREFCLELRDSVGTQRVLVVCMLRNWRDMRPALPLPIQSIAAARYFVAVASARPDWVVAGRLSDLHVGLLFESLPDDFDQAIALAAGRFSFRDPTFAGGVVQLQISYAIVPCSAGSSVRDLLVAASANLDAQGAPGARDSPRLDPVAACTEPVRE